MFERFTDRSRRVLVLAQEEARLLRHGYVGTEHLLLGLIHEGEGVGAKALELLGIGLEAAREKAKETHGPTGPLGSPPYTPRAKKVLELALREALALNHNYIGTEHILLGIVREGEGVAAAILVGLGTNLHAVRQQVNQLLTGYARTALTLSPHEIAFGTTPLHKQIEELAKAVLRRDGQGSERDLALAVLAESAPEPPELTVHYESSYRLTHRRGCPDAEAFVHRGACRTCGAEVEMPTPHIQRRFVNGVEVRVQEDPPTV